MRKYTQILCIYEQIVANGILLKYSIKINGLQIDGGYTDARVWFTRANLHGEMPCKTANEVRACFGDALDYILEGSVGDLAKPTPIYDALTGKVLRK